MAKRKYSKKRTNRNKKTKSIKSKQTKKRTIQKNKKDRKNRTIKKRNQRGRGFLKNIGSKTKEGALQVAHEGRVKGSQANRLLFQKKINDLKKWCKTIESLQPKFNGESLTVKPSWSDCYNTENENIEVMVNGELKKLKHYDDEILSIREKENKRRVERKRKLEEEKRKNEEVKENKIKTPETPTPTPTPTTTTPTETPETPTTTTPTETPTETPTDPTIQKPNVMEGKETLLRMGKSAIKNVLSEKAANKGKKGKSGIKDALSNLSTGISSEVTGGPNTGLLGLAESFISNK